MTINIARIFVEHPLGFRRTLEEEVFSSEETALAWLQKNFFEDDRYSGYSAEIVEFHIDKSETEMNKKRTKFSHTRQEIPEQPVPEIDLDFAPKFAKGDLVKFKTLSQTHLKWKDTFGVVSGVPLSVTERKRRFGKDCEMDFTDQMYTVEYISDTGFSDHTHLLEGDFEILQSELPEA